MSIEYINAIKEFEAVIHYKKESTIIELFVLVESVEGVLYEEKTNCRFYYEASYMQQVVEIDWHFNDATMHTMGLHSRYTTNFQEFELKEGTLVINANGIRIYITEDI